MTESFSSAGPPAPRSQTVGEAGEHRIIELVRSLVPSTPAWVTLGIGDDAAVVEAERNRLEVITTDVLVEGVHFDRAFCDPASIGIKALAVNLSDLAAMGAAPRAALLSLGLPGSLPFGELETMLRALVGYATREKVTLIGGNVTRSPGPLFVDVTLTGTVKRRRVLTRHGGRAGDELFVTGTLGAAAAGLAWLRQHGAIRDDAHQTDSVRAGAVSQDASREGASQHESVQEDAMRDDDAVRDAGLAMLSPEAGVPATKASAGAALPVSSGASEAIREAVDRFLRPRPRLRFGIIAGRTRAASACMDLSDGLADAVRQLARASGTGAVVEAEALPIHPGAAEVLGTSSKEAWRAALSGGEDYELLLAVPRRSMRRFLAVQRLTGLAATRIGALTAGPDLLLRQGGEDQPLPAGFEHFA